METHDHEAAADDDPRRRSPPAEGLTEEEVKEYLHGYLKRLGWDARVAWGHTRGVDIDARRGTDRWLIEVKGAGSRPPMRVNYFVGMLGELIQRMDDPAARYSIGLPDLPQFRGLWERLPTLAKQRLQITALLVREDGSVNELD